jgi:hypothetical protein
MGEVKHTPGVFPHDINARWAEKTFRLTFRCWGYTAQHDVTVGGNCLAMDNLGCALGRLYDRLPLSRDDVSQLLLTDDKGDTLLCEDDEDGDEQWLLEMLVCAELIDVAPDKPKKAAKATGSDQ